MKLKKYAKYFESMNDARLTVWQAREVKNGYDRENKYSPVATFDCNAQEFNRELAMKEYGYDLNCRMRCFAAPDVVINEGDGVSLNAKDKSPKYTAVAVLRRKMRTIILIDEAVR